MPTDLSKFKVITYYSSAPILESVYYIDYTNHNFEVISIHRDNSGAWAKCIDCNIEAHVYKNSYSGFVFDASNIENVRRSKLSCNELMIKNLLE